MRRKILPYNPKLKTFSRNLRNNPTPGETSLWKYLRTKQIKGYKFRRQVPISNYVLDFFCKELMLAIEIDGSSHAEKISRDKKRQKELESYGIEFLRFTESDVIKDSNNVALTILNWVDKNEKKNPEN
ncbi:MAG: endonuclease domain-containing protein [Ignavibacteriae bacterium]|nr:endonuclease domain-containing protein [Ignavibacteriota bacterium]MCB9244554.1 endonuclease domain-containing protein [Ignavibacteriales bacterium]